MPQIISANRAVRGLQGVVKSTTLFETRINTERVVDWSICKRMGTQINIDYFLLYVVSITKFDAMFYFPYEQFSGGFCVS